jgi:tRNA modification GTPase
LIVDTAGVRAAAEVLEAEGIRRAEDAVQHADLALVVLDRSVPLTDADRAVLTRTAGAPRIVVGTKMDLVPAWDTSALADTVGCVSATTGAGMPALVEELAAKLTPGSHAPRDVLVTNRRHLAALGDAWRHVDHACRAFADAGGEIPEEFVAADVQQALASLEELTGARIPEEVLQEIFARFCIGK